MGNIHPLRTLRQALGMTQAEFAAHLGITKGRISQVEGNEGRERLSGETLLKIVELYRDPMVQLGITIEDLIRGHRLEPVAGEATA